MSHPFPTRLLLCTGLIIALYSAHTLASPLQLDSAILLARQAATAGNDTDINSNHGGAASAANSAHAAGTSIETGAGGDRGTPTTPEEFARLLAGAFFGTLLSLFFGGVLLSSAWAYAERHGRPGSDRLIIQLAVAFLLALSLLENAVLVHRLWTVHVQNFGNFVFPLLTIGFQVSTSYVATGIMATIAQTFFAHRVWLAFNKSRWVSIPCAVLISYTFLGSIVSAILVIRSGSAANVKGYALHSLQPKSIPWQWSVCFATWLCSSTLLDIGLCIALIKQLSKMKSNVFHTQYAIARLLLLSLETCFLTTSFSLASMILMLAQPAQFYYSITYLPLGQVYSLSLLATLMSRPSIARELAVAQGIAGPNARDVDEMAASQATPVTLARPVIRRLMKKEQRRAHGEVSIKMTTEVHQMQSKCDDLAPCLEEPWPVEEEEERDDEGGSDTTMGDSNIELGLPSSRVKADAAETRSINSLAPFTTSTDPVPAALNSILSPPANISQHPPTLPNLNRPLPPSHGITPRGRIVRVASPIQSAAEHENEKSSTS